MIWRHVASNFLTLLIVILIAVAAAVAWAKHQYTAPGPSAVASCVRVPPGASLSAVSESLAAQGVVSNAYIFRAGADYAGKSRDLKYGSYLMPPGASMADVVAAITAGGPSTCGTEIVFRIGVRENSVILRDTDAATGQMAEQAKYIPGEPVPAPIQAAEARPDARLRIAVAEGVTSWQVVEGLKQAGFLAGEVADLPEEGSLAPDTYDVQKGADRATLLAEMARRQANFLAQAWEARETGLPYQTPQEALIMASIIEKETGVPEERGEISGVFVRRLERGMLLQTDPTVIYGMGEAYKGRITRTDLRTPTPYNTYTNAGLPPTPIAMVGREAIRAALNPVDGSSLYFVARGDGSHVFSDTLEQHNRAVREYQLKRRADYRSSPPPRQAPVNSENAQ